MKKAVSWGTLFGLVALIVLLAVGTVGAQDEMPEDAEPEAVEVPAEPDPKGTAVRINFELAPGHSAKRGHYSVQDEGGGEIASWYALDGWRDSGWIDRLDIARETVLVRVLYYPGPDTEPTVMRILNPAPFTEFGWMSQDIAHAIEVAWPDMPVEGFDVEEAE
ncbi:MAG: hypothetical protein R3293_13665 [Candidatus Promineifilaceae bacterium]|nr:hypothetical protein [Candidatus Promineifilaceae bacterium]